MEIPNRIVMPPMTTRLAAPDGSVTPELIQYFVARAEGGAGLITVEMCSPHPAGRHRARELGISDDRFVAGLRELTSRLRAAGSRVAVQIGHAGGLSPPRTRAIRAVARVPTTGVGRLHAPELAAMAVREGHADMVALGRQLIADPEWPRKVREGRTDEIRPCIA